MSQRKRVAFLGLGAMGSRMAARLIGAGHDVTVWNRSPGPQATLQRLGAQVAPTPSTAVEGAEVVISMVYDDAASRAVWLDPQSGAATSLHANAIAVECSTLSIAWVRELGARLPIPLVDAPVAGSRPQAEAGQLIFMAGGPAHAVGRVTPVLLDMGNAVHDLGEPGSGSLLKLAVNSLFGVQVLAIAEQLSLLKLAGLDSRRALDALRAMPVLSPAAAGAGALMLAANHQPQAPVDLIKKDLSYAVAACTDALPLTRLTLDRYEAASLAGLGEENITAVAKLYR